MDDYYIRNKNHPNVDGFLLTIFIHFWILTIPAQIGVKKIFFHTLLWQNLKNISNGLHFHACADTLAPLHGCTLLPFVDGTYVNDCNMCCAMCTYFCKYNHCTLRSSCGPDYWGLTWAVVSFPFVSSSWLFSSQQQPCGPLHVSAQEKKAWPWQ